MGFDGNGPTAGITAHPLNAYRATASPHIPQQLPWHRGQGRQRHGAHFAFGQLAVVVIGRVGQARETRPASHSQGQRCR